MHFARSLARVLRQGAGTDTSEVGVIRWREASRRTLGFTGRPHRRGPHPAVQARLVSRPERLSLSRTAGEGPVALRVGYCGCGSGASAPAKSRPEPVTV